MVLPTELVSVDSASDDEFLCRSGEDSKVECDADTDSLTDLVVNDSAPGDTSGTTESSSGLQQLDMNMFIFDEVDPAVVSSDLGKVVKLKPHHSLTDHEKHAFLTQHFVPSPRYKFPTRVFNGHQHHFQHSWLSKCHGLVYSEMDDGG